MQPRNTWRRHKPTDASTGASWTCARARCHGGRSLRTGESCRSGPSITQAPGPVGRRAEQQGHTLSPPEAHTLTHPQRPQLTGRRSRPRTTFIHQAWRTVSLMPRHLPAAECQALTKRCFGKSPRSSSGSRSPWEFHSVSTSVSSCLSSGLSPAATRGVFQSVTETLSPQLKTSSGFPLASGQGSGPLGSGALRATLPSALLPSGAGTPAASSPASRSLQSSALCIQSHPRLAARQEGLSILATLSDPWLGLLPLQAPVLPGSLMAMLGRHAASVPSQDQLTYQTCRQGCDVCLGF